MSENEQRATGSGDSQGQANSEGNEAQNSNTTTQSGSVFPAIKAKLFEDKVESAMWISRIITVACAFFTLIPILGDHHSMYSKALISCALTNALRLHQRVPQFRFSREYLSQVMLEDSCHYLLFALLFATSVAPFTMALTPVTLFALLASVKFTHTILNIIGPNSLSPIRWITSKLTVNSMMLYRFVAINEILLMPSLIFMIFGGKTTILAPFLYYRFLCLRYASRRNHYSKQVFYELRVATDSLTAHPSCPSMIRTLVMRVQWFILRIAPQVA